MIVRYKLDSCGVKLKLQEWARLSYADKRTLAYMPCFTFQEIEHYGNFIKTVIKNQFGYEASMLTCLDDSWNDIHRVPEEVQKKSAEWECGEITLKEWIGLDILQRFALVKLSRSGHEGSNFPIALKEFEIS